MNLIRALGYSRWISVEHGVVLAFVICTYSLSVNVQTRKRLGWEPEEDQVLSACSAK